MQPAIGFLKLDTRFPRGPGDAGCAATWRFPALYYTVRRASPSRVIPQRADDLLPAFIAGGKKLAARGAAGISATCGFLVRHQNALAAALPVPVMASALLYGPRLQQSLPAGKSLGILTVSPKDLSAADLRAAGLDISKTIIGGLPPSSATADSLLNNRRTLDAARAKEDMRLAAEELRRSGGGKIGAVLLECANMPAFSGAVAAAAGAPVFSILDAVNDFYGSLAGA
ncbi:MAG: aspartate/glutamate racemase family protein [Gammaproteobacteria bacterium]